MTEFEEKLLETLGRIADSLWEIERLASSEAQSTVCEFCGHVFAAAAGRYGCPNCNGEGLDDG